GLISAATFKTFGCGVTCTIAIASSSFMTERLTGMLLTQAEKIKSTDIAQELFLPPSKLHCASGHVLQYRPRIQSRCKAGGFGDRISRELGH
ncbi:NifU-like protein, partial [Mycena leptocephala]